MKLVRSPGGVDQVGVHHNTRQKMEWSEQRERGNLVFM